MQAERACPLGSPMGQATKNGKEIRTVEKIMAEELMKEFPGKLLTEEELQYVVGGGFDSACHSDCISQARLNMDGEFMNTCLQNCVQ